MWAAVIALAAIGVFAAVGRTRFLVHVLVSGYRPSSDPVSELMDGGFARHPLLTLAHVLPGLLFMVLGPLQFSRGIRSRKLAFHRWSGRVFVASSLIVGISALVMAVRMSIGGFNETAATVFFATWFLIALGKAFWHIRCREISLHREWMIRAFAIGLAIATIRPIEGIFFTLYFTQGFLSPQEFFGIGFWIGFTLHLIAAEIWIGATRPA